MPRGRALRVLGAALFAAAVPGLRPRRATAAATPSRVGPRGCEGGIACGGACCFDGNTVCCPIPGRPPGPGDSACCRPGNTCCNYVDAFGQNQACCIDPTVICDTAMCFKHVCTPTGCEYQIGCPPNKRECGSQCCDPDEACIEHRCVRVRRCKGPLNEIDRVETASGSDHGLAGTSVLQGQTIDATDEQVTLVFKDDIRIRFKKGTKVRVTKCLREERTQWELDAGEIWADFKKAVAGSDQKFKLEAGRTMSGPRGTTFSVAYSAARRRTTVRVFDGAVEVRGIRGVRGKVLVRKGQTAVQQGDSPPRITRR